MSVFGRRVTPEQLATELLRGLESGEIVFTAPPEGNEPSTEEARLAALCAKLQALVDRAAEVLPPVGEGAQLNRTESLAQIKDELRQVARQLGAA